MARKYKQEKEQVRRCQCECLDVTETCDCGFKVGDRVIVTGDTANFSHSLGPDTKDVLKEHCHWGNGTGWRLQSGWDVSCEDMVLADPPVSDDEVNEAIASILKEK